MLLIGPYDPMGGEYTFLAPPLGVCGSPDFFTSTASPPTCSIRTVALVPLNNRSPR